MELRLESMSRESREIDKVLEIVRRLESLLAEEVDLKHILLSAEEAQLLELLEKKVGTISSLGTPNRGVFPGERASVTTDGFSLNAIYARFLLSEMDKFK